MGTKTHFNLIDHRFFKRFFNWKVFQFLGSFWDLLCNYLFDFFQSIFRFFVRFSGNETSEKDELISAIRIESEENRKIDSGNSEFEFSFGLGIQNHVFEGVDETEKTENLSSVSKYEFKAGKDFSLFLEEPKVVSFSVHEMFEGSDDSTNSSNETLESQLSDGDYFWELNLETGEKTEGVHQEKEIPPEKGKTEESFSTDGLLKFSNEIEIPEKGNLQNLENGNDLSNDDRDLDGVSTNLDDHERVFELNSTGGQFKSGNLENLENGHDLSNEDRDLDGASTNLDDHEQVFELDSTGVQFKLSEKLDSGNLEFVSEKLGDEHLEGNFDEGPNLEEKPLMADYYDDDDEDDDMTFGHEDLINQLKMEFQNARCGGLPTIEEESESPTMEDFKPLKIDEKFEFKDRIEEIQKVYKNYCEKMRKLDILNYQTMHAIGFLQMKDSKQSIPRKSSSNPANTFNFLQNFLPSNKPKRSSNDSSLKFMEELELVYIGQVCLSWEILHWQYRKSRELHEYDPQGFRQYNQVAGEFQLFQVFIHRFIEDEPYQGPRIPYYVKRRCVVRNLLQVPVIKDDSWKDKNRGKTGENDDYVVSSGMLREITRKSLRVFWEFLRADNTDYSFSLKGNQDPANTELLMSIQKDFHKKEKRLKELLRTGSCIVKRLQKNQEGNLHHSLLLAQVELILVSMVLNMSRLSRDRLLWCHEKLGKINFVGRKVQVEPCFLLFPC